MCSPIARFVFAIVLGAHASTAQAQLLSRRDLSYSIAKTIAETAIERCTANGYRVSAVVVDRAGETIVALRGDNASPHTMENARRKAYTALSFRTSTTAYAKRLADGDPGRLGAPRRLAGSALPAACEDLTFVELEKVSSDIDRLWTKLRAVTPAQIGLARSGSWVETRLLLDFQLAHAEAQDAVKDRIDADRLIADLKSRGLDMVCLSSKAPDRKTYLARPDLGRELNESAKDALSRRPKGFDIVFVLCDGLSADAVMQHAMTLLDERYRPCCEMDGVSDPSQLSSRAGSPLAMKLVSSCRRR